MEKILELLPAYLTILSTVCGGVTIALVAGVAIWTFRDIRSRSRDFLAQVLATLLVLVLPVIGLVVYLMLRPHETLAEAYERSLEQEALLHTPGSSGPVRRAGARSTCAGRSAPTAAPAPLPRCSSPSPPLRPRGLLRSSRRHSGREA